MIIGVISDTHGVLKAEAAAALKGAGHIIHAGDIGAEEVLSALRRMAPVTAVRGNTDHGTWSRSLPGDELVQLNGATLYVLHDVTEIDLEPAAAGIHMVISGHTHQPSINRANGVIYLNPGSASHRRRGGPLSIGRIHVTPQGLNPEIVILDH